MAMSGAASVTGPIVPAVSGVAGWRIERRPIDHPDAAMLVEEVQGEYVDRYGSRDETPVDPAYFLPPGGAFFVGYLGDDPVATGATHTATGNSVLRGER